MLVQGSTLTTAARRLGVALKQATHAVSRVELDIPGQTEQEIVGYPVTADSVILGLSRLPAWARVVMVVRKGHILDAPEAGALRPGDYCYFLVGRDRLPRLDTLFRESRDVARRLGLLFGELPIRGETKVSEVEQFYGLDFGPHVPETTLAEWATARLGGRPPRRDAGDPQGEAGGAPARIGADRQHGAPARRAAAGRAGREAAGAPGGRGGRARGAPAPAGAAVAAAVEEGGDLNGSEVRNPGDAKG